MAGNTTYRIGNAGVVLLIAGASLADLLSLIPLVGDVVGPLFWICAGFYFYKQGMGVISMRRAIPTIISFVGELIPVVQELPMILGGIIAVIIITRIEDRTGIQLPATKSFTKMNKPLNSGGVRAPQRKNPKEQDTEQTT